MKRFGIASWRPCQVFGLVCGLGFLTAPLAATPETLNISLGSQFTVENGGSATRHLAFLEHLNGVTFSTYSQHPDAVLFPTTDGMRRSTDGGATWPVNFQNPNFYITSIVRLSATDLLATNYVTQRIDARHSTSYYWTSTDNGASWSPHTGTVTFPVDQGTNSANWGGLLFHRSLFKMPDGSLQGTMYGKYVGDTRFRCLWVKSTDNAATWSVVSTIAYNGSIGTEGFCEPVAITAADGSLLVVMRIGSSQPLYQTRSTDGGLTWATPTTLPGVVSTDTYSVDPDLTLMANGTLVLSYGRPTTNILFSLDGSGYTWGYRLADTIASSASDYTGIREVATDKLLQITDNSTRTQILGKYVTVTRSLFNSFENDATGSVPVGYEAVGASGTVSTAHAFAGTKSLRINDASGSILTNVVKVTTASAAATFEAQVYPVASPTGNVISLTSGGNDNTHAVFHLNLTSTGAIDWYNGSSWVNLAPAGAVTFNAWNKIRIAAPTAATARIYVNDVYKGSAGKWNTFSTIDRVRLMSGSTGGTGDDFYLDNVYFYPDVLDDFEGDTVGSAPVGYTIAGANGVVSTAHAFAGTKSLRINDSSGSTLTTVVKNVLAGRTKTFEAQVYPVASPTGNVISLSSGGDTNASSVFHLSITSAGAIDWYNGSGWVNLAPAGTVAFNAWNKIRIAAANTTSASVYVNDVLKGTAGKWNTFSTIDRVRFMSGSTGGTGDDFYVDNVTLY